MIPGDLEKASFPQVQKQPDAANLLSNPAYVPLVSDGTSLYVRMLVSGGDLIADVPVDNYVADQSAQNAFELFTASMGMLYNPTTGNWDRARAVVDNADVAAGSAGLTGVVARLTALDGATWRRVTMTDLINNGNNGTMYQQYGLYAHALALTVEDSNPQHTGWPMHSAAVTVLDGGNVSRGVVTYSNTYLDQDEGTNSKWRGASAIHMNAAATGYQKGVAMVTAPGNWSVPSFPAVAAAASASKAAGGAGIRYICTGAVFSVAAGATALPPTQVVIRDGASGVGAIIWSGVISCPANDSRQLNTGPLSLVGSANVAMTAEFAAGGATVQQSVTLTGYNVG